MDIFDRTVMEAITDVNKQIGSTKPVPQELTVRSQRLEQIRELIFARGRKIAEEAGVQPAKPPKATTDEHPTSTTEIVPSVERPDILAGAQQIGLLLKTQDMIAGMADEGILPKENLPMTFQALLQYGRYVLEKEAVPAGIAKEEHAMATLAKALAELGVPSPETIFDQA
jgi:hypothetical protein